MSISLTFYVKQNRFSLYSGNSIYRLIGESACSSPDLSLARQTSETEDLETSETDDLEYEYEPGISLSNLEFGRSGDDTTNDISMVFARTKCLLCGSDYESGRWTLR